MRALKYDADGVRTGRSSDWVADLIDLLDATVSEVGAHRVEVLVGGDAFEFAALEATEVVLAAKARGVVVRQEGAGINVVELPAT